MTTVSKYEDEQIMNELAKLACCLKRAVIFQESLPLKKSMEKKDQCRIEILVMLMNSAMFGYCKVNIVELFYHSRLMNLLDFYNFNSITFQKKTFEQ